MRGVNKVILICTLGKDPEVKYMPNGTAVVNLSAATNESWTDKQTGEKKERAEWHRITFYGRMAEICGEYLHKGHNIYVEGSLRTRDYEKDGQKHYITEVIGFSMQMLSGKSKSASDEEPAESQQPASGSSDFQDDDIPF